MAQWNKDAEQVMAERFDKDTVIALATVDEETPHARFVNAIYTDGVFYFITDARSNKIRHMEKQPVVAIAGEWFTAHGRAVNLGPWVKEANQPIARTLKRAFAAWIDNGHHDLQDVNTCIVRIDLTDGALFSHGTRYDIGGE